MERELDFIFLVNGDLTFLMHSLKDVLDKKGYSTDKCDFDILKLEKITIMPEFFIADAEVLLKDSTARAYLYDRCIESNKKIILIGDPLSLKSIYDVTVTNVIEKTYERPINTFDIAEDLTRFIQNIKDKGLRKRILVVDDSAIFLRLIAEWLEDDYNVNVCPSAMAAFHMIGTSKPDLILLDYEMPVCDGARFLQMLHSEPSTEDIPVMFLTSKDDINTVKSLIALKPQGYLLKNQSRDATLKAIADFFLKESKN